MLTAHSIGRTGNLFVFVLISSVFCVSASAQQARNRQPPARPAATSTPAPVASEKLPLRRVVLYKSGVGYFEHAGLVRGNQDVEIDLTGSQLDDVLKSLTALDLNGGRIVGASYSSQEPAGHQLESLPVPVAGSQTLTSLLEGLRGVRLEVSTSTGAFNGRLLSIQQQTRREAGAEVTRDEISLLGDSGSVRSFVLEPGTNLRFADRPLEQELARALGLLDSSHREDTRQLLLSTTGTGERQVQVSYTSEVPVWKTTYRIVLPGSESPSGTKPLLQGWAVVDNTVGEDWTDVQLSLAAGAPQSFIQKLSQPYYAQRVAVPLPRGFLLAPQTHGGTMISADALQQVTVTPEAGPINGRVLNSGALGGLGAGAAGGTGGGAFRPGTAQAPASPAEGLDFLAAAKSINAAQGNQLGDLFEYRLKDRVTMGFVPGAHAESRPRLDDKVERTAIETAKRKFAPEFMNRIDKVVVFRPLRSQQLEQILKIELGMVQKRLLETDRPFLFRVTPAAQEFLFREGTDLKYGARHLKRAVERDVVWPLANLRASDQLSLGDVISIDWNGSDTTLTFSKHAESVPVQLAQHAWEHVADAVALADGLEISFADANMGIW